VGGEPLVRFKEVGGGRPIEGRCLFCHSNRVEVRPEYSTGLPVPVADPRLD
jgi:hypothetical protein